MIKRKAFNFYKSYYDVYVELSDKDKLMFMNALLSRQFTGVEIELSGMARFAYLSQKHNIDSQVAGYESKTGTSLAPCEGGSVGGSEGGSAQEKEKEKVKGKEKGKEDEIVFSFDEFWDKYPTKVAKVKCKSKFESLSNIDRQKIKDTIDLFASFKPFKDYTHPHPMTYLNQERWNDEREDMKLEANKPFKLSDYNIPTPHYFGFSEGDLIAKCKAGEYEKIEL